MYNYGPRGGLGKNLNRKARFTFLGSEIWLKFIFLGEKNIIIFLDSKFLKIYFGVTQGDQIIFGGRGRAYVDLFQVPAVLLFCTQLI